MAGKIYMASTEPKSVTLKPYKHGVYSEELRNKDFAIPIRQKPVGIIANVLYLSGGEANAEIKPNVLYLSGGEANADIKSNILFLE